MMSPPIWRYILDSARVEKEGPKLISGQQWRKSDNRETHHTLHADDRLVCVQLNIFKVVLFDSFRNHGGNKTAQLRVEWAGAVGVSDNEWFDLRVRRGSLLAKHRMTYNAIPKVSRWPQTLGAQNAE